jgi:citronellol/citronellal dehydrogenase
MADTSKYPPLYFAPDMLTGKVALVTGGGTGMGRVTAIQMARCGAQVVLYSRRLEVLEACAAEIKALGGSDVLCIAGDTREPEQIDAALERIDQVHGGLDILVNNAGGQYVSAAKDISNKGFAAVINNNLIASWQVTSAVAHRFMLKGGGKIIFVTAAHRAGFRGFSHTASARGGVAALVKSLAAEWAEHGIQVNAVAPGTVEVEAMAQYPIPRERWDAQKRNLQDRMGKPDDVANTIVFLASPMGDFITGEEWYVDGGETLNLAHDSRELIDDGMYHQRKRADE